MLIDVKLLRHVGAVLLLLVSFATPAIACTPSGAGLTAEQRACCHTMESDCGLTQMPAPHDCCKQAPGALHDSALRPDVVVLHPVAAVAVWTLPVDLPSPDVKATRWSSRPEHSPPDSPASILSVLRV